MIAVGILCVLSSAQTFEIQGQKPQPAPPAQKGKSSKGTSNASGPSSGNQEISWGTSIDVARQSRAAEDALKRGDYNAATNYASNAAKAAPQEARLWFLLGYASRLSGKYNESVDAFNRGLQVQPNSIEGLSGLAQTYARMGNFNQARALLTRVIALNPKRANDLAIAGEMFLHAGDVKGAVDLLSRAESIAPGSRTELLLASSYLKMKQPDQAKKFLLMAQRRDPNNKDTLRALAGYYRDAKDYPAAIAALKKVGGKNADVTAELGYTYELAKQYPEAAATYAQAADLAPKQIGLQLSAASAEVRVGDHPKAQLYLKRAAEIDPNHYRLHGTLAEIARMENRTNDSIREYTLALANMPESVPEGPLYPIQLRMNLSDSYHDIGDEAAAKSNASLASTRIAGIEVEPAQKADFFRLRASINGALGNIAAAQADIKQALALEPDNTNLMLQLGNLLWRAKQTNEARDMFAKVLSLEPKNKFALTQLGFLSREMGDPKAAEGYFQRLVSYYPREYTAHLALGDLYTAARNFDAAENSYLEAYKYNKNNPLIISGGANAGIESKKFDRAGAWLARATPAMNEHPFVMRERERYLTWQGKYLEAAKLGYRVIDKMPTDRDAVVYLGYSLLYLGRFDDLLRLTAKYEPILNRDAALPLLSGYVYRKSELLDEAQAAFTRSIERNDTATTAFVNRGYVLNDLQNPEMAVRDFNHALALEPDNGEANLGLAFAYLQLHKPALTLEHVDRAAKVLKESKATHLARAGGYRQKLLLGKAENEYRSALKFEPDDSEVRMALAQVLFGEKRYQDAITAYQALLPITEDHSFIYASMANASAHLRRKDDAYRYIQAAEREGGDSAAVMLATGDTLLTLGQTDAAMARYERALTAPDSTRVDVRLAFAKTFQHQGKWDDARQQIALAFTESRVGESSAVTPENLATAASLFLAMNDFPVATEYYEMARNAGADDRPVRIGLANTYLAQGDFKNAEAELAGLGDKSGNVTDYDYMLAYANLNRQQRNTTQAMLGFARARELALDDDSAERALHEVAGEEGYSVNEHLSLASDFHVAPIFEDATVYDLDAKLRGIVNPALLPTPRSSTETYIGSDYRVHFKNLPAIVGSYGLRNARGQFVFPSDLTIFDRNTYDTSFSVGINPVLHLGRAALSLTPGIQFTIRRDSNVPADLNQNLFRTFLYLNTSPLFSWLSVRGSANYETGPFTERNLSSRDALGHIEFVVGRPWGNTAMVTGYRVRDLQFNPDIREFFTTSTYAGLEHKFGRKITGTLVGEYIRSWRVESQKFAIAQAMRPAAQLEIRPNNRWQFEFNFAYTRTEATPAYDNLQSGFLISYVKPFRRTWNDGAGETVVEYPLRFSVGMQQQSFMNFPGQNSSAYVPVVRLNIF
jgi:tetratricopeptide (TPR) repeat protein